MAKLISLLDFKLLYPDGSETTLKNVEKKAARIICKNTKCETLYQFAKGTWHKIKKSG